jgi:hypothetical protein
MAGMFASLDGEIEAGHRFAEGLADPRELGSLTALAIASNGYGMVDGTTILNTQWRRSRRPLHWE